MLLTKSQKNAVKTASMLSRAFEVRVTIKLFGRTILDYKWPPDSDLNVEPLNLSNNELL